MLHMDWLKFLRRRKRTTSVQMSQSQYRSFVSLRSKSHRTSKCLPPKEYRWSELGHAKPLCINLAYGGASYYIVEAVNMGFGSENKDYEKPLQTVEQRNFGFCNSSEASIGSRHEMSYVCDQRKCPSKSVDPPSKAR